MKHLHFPIAILTHNGGLIIAAAKAHPEIITRLTDPYITAADTLCQKVTGDVTGQKTAKGELGNLTAAQTQNLNTLHQCMAQAAKTAKLAFPGGQTVKLHQEFQVGPHDKNDLGSYLGRVDIVLGSIANAANLAVLKLAAGLQWPAADPANAGVRGEFLLGIFPPDHGGNHAPAPAPTPATPKP
jgi:hypothetical protein